MADLLAVFAIPILLLLGVGFILIGGLLINFLKLIYAALSSKDFIFHSLFGDLSWIFPFKANELDFRFTNLLLVCILLVAIAGLLVGWSYVNRWQEIENRKNKILLELLAKQTEALVNKVEQPAAGGAQEIKKEIAQEEVTQKAAPKPADSKKNK